MRVSRIFSLFGVLQAGRSLSNPAVWKNTDAAVKAVSIIVLWLGTLAYDQGWIAVSLSDAKALTIASGIVSVVLAVSTFLTYATSRKVGYTPRGLSRSNPRIEAYPEDPLEDHVYQWTHGYLPETDAAWCGGGNRGVLHRPGGLRDRINSLPVEGSADSDRHPGDDPDISGFNR